MEAFVLCHDPFFFVTLPTLFFCSSLLYAPCFVPFLCTFFNTNYFLLFPLYIIINLSLFSKYSLILFPSSSRFRSPFSPPITILSFSPNLFQLLSFPVSTKLFHSPPPPSPSISSSPSLQFQVLKRETE